MSTKLDGRMGQGSRRKPLHFETDPEKGQVQVFLITFFNIVKSNIFHNNSGILMKNRTDINECLHFWCGLIELKGTFGTTECHSSIVCR